MKILWVIIFGKIMRFFIAAGAFYGLIIILLWFAGPPSIKGPKTARTCSEFINRIWEKGPTYELNSDEQNDFKICGEALRSESGLRGRF